MPNKNLKTFKELSDNYTCFKNGTTEDVCNAWLVVDDKVQKAVRWLKGKLHQQKILELYDKFYEKALEGDYKAFNAIVQFSKTYFVNDEEEDNIMSFLQGMKIPKDTESKSNEDSDLDTEDIDEEL